MKVERRDESERRRKGGSLIGSIRSNKHFPRDACTQLHTTLKPDTLSNALMSQYFLIHCTCTFMCIQYQM